MTGSVGDVFVRLGIDPSGLSSGFSAAESTMERMGNRLFYMGARLTAGITVPVVAAGTAITKWGMDFDQAMTESLAIMQNITPQIRQEMEDTAKSVSDHTKFSAKDAAAAYYDLASAGLTAAEAMGSIDTVAKFAQAGVMDLKEAGEFLAGSVTAVGTASMGTTDKISGMAKMADLLTQANNYALGTVEDFANAITNRSGQALRMYNVDVEEGIAALMAYAEQNIKGKNAGQQLYITLRDLQRASEANSGAWKDLGIQVFNATGQLNPLHRIIGQMEQAFLGLTDQQKHAAFATLGMQDRSKSATLALIGMSDEMRRYQKVLEDAAGTTERVAAKQMEAMKNQLIQLWHQFQNAGISIYQQFVPVIERYLIPAFQTAIEKMKGVAEWLKTLTVEQRAALLATIALAAALGPLIGFIGSLLLFVRAITAPMQLMAAAMGAKGAAGAAGEIAEKAAPAVSMMTRMLSVVRLLTNPWVLLGAAIATAVLYVKDSVGGWQRLYDVLNALSLGSLAFTVELFRGMIGVLGNVTTALGNLGMGFVNMARVGIGAVNDLISQALNKLADWGGKQRDAVSGMGNVKGTGWFQSFNDYWAHQAAGGDAAVSESAKKAYQAAADAHIDARAKAWEQSMARARGKFGDPFELHDQLVDPTTGLIRVPGREPNLDTQEEKDRKAAAIKRYGEMLAEYDMFLAERAKEDEEAFKKWVLESMKAEREAFDFSIDMAMERAERKEAIDKAHWEVIDGAALAFMNEDLERMKESGEYYRDHYNRLIASGTASAREIARAWEEWYKRDYENRHAQMIGWMDTLDILSDAFKTLAQIAGEGTFGGIVRDIGAMIASLKLAGEGMAAYDKGMAQVRDGKTAEGFANIAAGVMSMAAAMMQATSSSNRLMSTLGGMSTGAQIGSMFGPIGAGIGAIAGGIFGFFRGGANKAREMREEMEKLSKSFIDSHGGLKDLTKTAEKMGISLDAFFNAKTPDQMKRAIASINTEFERLEEQAANAKEFLSTFKGVLDTVAASGRLASREVLDMIARVRESGGATAEIRAFMRDQVSKAAAGVTQYLTLTSEAYKTMADKEKELGAARQELADFDAKIGEDKVKTLEKISRTEFDLTQLRMKLSTAEGNDRVKILQQIKEKEFDLAQLREKLGDVDLAQRQKILDKIKELIGAIDDQRKIIELTNVTTQDAANAMAAVFLGAFGEMVKSGMSVGDALKQLSPGIVALEEQMKRAGLTGSDAFNQILAMANMMRDKIAGPAIDAINGLGSALVGMHNAGLLNQQTFVGLANQITQTYQGLIRQGYDGNTALRLMQPTLQTLWELMEDYGFEVDASTLALIEQGKAAGLVGDQHRAADEKIAVALQELIQLLKDFLAEMRAIPGVAADVADDVEDHFDNIHIDPIIIPIEPDFGDFTPPDSWSTYNWSGPGGGDNGGNNNGGGDYYSQWLRGFLADNPGDEARARRAFESDPENMKHMATGGIAMGPMRALIGEAGPEAVIPLDRMSSMFGGHVSDAHSTVHDDYLHQEVVRLRTDLRRRNEQLPVIIRDAVLQATAGRR